MKKIKYSLSIALSILIGKNIYAQQEYQFVNSAYNTYLLNPAAGGLSDVIQIEAGTRMQWTGYEGAPQTFMLTGNSQIRFSKKSDNLLEEFNNKDEKFFRSPKMTSSKNKHVVGGKIYSDIIGPFMKTSVQGSYAYHLPLTKKLNIGAGLGFGYSNFRINEGRVVLNQTDDVSYQQFLGTSSAQNLGDVQAGLVLYGEKLFVSISGTQLLKSKVKWNQVTTESNLNRHLFVVTRYKFEINEQSAIEPSLVLKSTLNSPASMDFGVRYIHNGAFWGGIQYRTNSSLVFNVGANLIKNLYLNYSFDQAFGKIGGRGVGSHEVQLGIYIGNNRNVDKELKDKESTNEN